MPKVKHLPIWYMKGATMYELQIGSVMITWCHLKGGYWKRRFMIQRLHICKHGPEGKVRDIFFKDFPYKPKNTF